MLIENFRYTSADWMGYGGTVTTDGTPTVTLANGSQFIGAKASGWIIGKPITVNGTSYTVKSVVDASHLTVDRAIASSGASEYSFSIPGLDPKGVIQIAQHGPVILRNSTVGTDNRWPLRIWWNNNPGYRNTPSLFRIENVIFHSKGPKFAQSTNLAATDALFIGAWPDTVNSWMMTGTWNSGIGTNVSMSTQPIWIKHRVAKVATGIGDCLNISGCWQIDDGALPSSKVLSGGADNPIVITSLPGGGYVSDLTLKTVLGCTGGQPVVVGIGNNTDFKFYTDQIKYDLRLRASESNQLNVPLTNRGSSRLTITPSQENAVHEYFTVFVKAISGNMEDVVDGCAFDVYMLVGRRPMEMPTGQ